MKSSGTNYCAFLQQEKERAWKSFRTDEKPILLVVSKAVARLLKVRA